MSLDKPPPIDTTAIVDGTITDADISASGITTRSKLPAAIAYTDQGNTFATGNQVFSAGSQFILQDPTTNSKTLGFDLSSQSASTKLTLAIAAITANRTLNIPLITGTDTLATLALANAFTGANSFSSTQSFTNTTPFSVANAQTVNISVTSQTVGTGTISIPNLGGTSDNFCMTNLSQNISNKKFADSNVSFVNSVDSTKALKASLGGMTTGVTLTLSSSQSSSQTLSIPNIAGADTIVTLGLAQTFTSLITLNSNLAFGATASIISKYKNITTAGVGVPPIYASYSTTGNVGAVTNAINYTPPATAGRYRISGIVNMISWTTPASFTVVVTYKDDSGNSRTETMAVTRGSTGAVAAAITAVDRWYFELPIFAIDTSATAITVSTTGTFTGSPSYNLSAVLEQVA